MDSSNRLRTAFAAGGPAWGFWQMIPGANLSRMMARTPGIDWVLIDCEHGNLDDAAMHDAVPAVAAAGVSPIVRVPGTESWMIKRALDSGAHGILVPLLETAQEARDIVKAAKFPPWGKRGFGSPWAPERFTPIPTMSQYLQKANDSLLTMVQIETKKALDELEDIAAVTGIDVLFIGPNDLGNNIGHPIIDGKMHPELLKTINCVLEVSHKAGKKCGIYCASGKQAKEFADAGFDMVHVGTDATTLQFALSQEMKDAMGQEAAVKSGSY
ncbi:hypothetical protein FDECE_17309 [Fusarium decemcellulare]|nr:hypothetical protein FDECE_17309 [Fusarium decemcellulare]